MSPVDAKVAELCRTVLGHEASIYIDTEAALDAVLDRLSDDDAKGAGKAADDGDTLERIRDSIDECRSDLSSIEYRLDEYVSAKERKR